VTPRKLSKKWMAKQSTDKKSSSKWPVPTKGTENPEAEKEEKEEKEELVEKVEVPEDPSLVTNASIVVKLDIGRLNSFLIKKLKFFK
jgi:hypothetical protein